MNTSQRRPFERVEVLYTLVCCQFRDQFLMVNRAKPPFAGRWNFLGGKIEPSELPEASARREVFEEAGFDARSGLDFRGIALWPKVGDDRVLLGMHLFGIRIARSPKHVCQTFLLDEGVLSWLSERELLDGSVGPVVPNFELLLPVFTRRAPCPTALLHWLGRARSYEVKELPLPLHLWNPKAWGQGPAKLEIGEVLDTGLIAEVG